MADFGNKTERFYRRFTDWLYKLAQTPRKQRMSTSANSRLGQVADACALRFRGVYLRPNGRSWYRDFMHELQRPAAEKTAVAENSPATHEECLQQSISRCRQTCDEKYARRGVEKRGGGGALVVRSTRKPPRACKSRNQITRAWPLALDPACYIIMHDNNYRKNTQ